jgi:hypothetical protein
MEIKFHSLAFIAGAKIPAWTMRNLGMKWSLPSLSIEG